MREIRLSDLNPYCILKDLLVHCWIIVLCAVTAMLGTEIVLVNIYRPQYTSSMTYFVSPKDSSNSAYYNLSTAYDMAVAICEVFQSDIMAVKASESMGLGALPGTVSASVPEDTNLLHLAATSDSPENAFKTVRAIMENHKQVSDYVFNNVVVDILDPPAVPVSPSNQVSTGRAKKLAAAIGAALAALLIIVLSVLRDTVKTEASLKYSLDTKLFAVLRHETKYKTLKSLRNRTGFALLITNPVIGFTFTETIKSMCTKLEHVNSLRGHKCFLVTSSCENEGKSTISANLAIGLAKRGHRVLLIDGDLKKPAQYKILGKKAQDFMDFAKYLTGKASLKEALRYDSNTGLYLLLNKHSYMNAADLIATPYMEALMNQCRDQMDYIIIDSPPAIVASDTEVLVNYCDASLMVVRQDHSFVKTLNDTIEKLQTRDLLGCVYNDAISFPLKSTGGYEKAYSHYYSKA